jgi:hypothetical protein
VKFFSMNVLGKMLFWCVVRIHAGLLLHTTHQTSSCNMAPVPKTNALSCTALHQGACWLGGQLLGA